MARGIDHRRGSKAGIFGYNLLRLRTDARLTQNDLAISSGVSRVTISRLESGQHEGPEPKSVLALASALRCPEAELWRQKEPEPQIGVDPAKQSPSDRVTDDQPRISMNEFLSAARGVLEDTDLRRLDRLRTRLDPRGFSKRAWLRIVMDLREDENVVGSGG